MAFPLFFLFSHVAQIPLIRLTREKGYFYLFAFLNLLKVGQLAIFLVFIIVIVIEITKHIYVQCLSQVPECFTLAYIHLSADDMCRLGNWAATMDIQNIQLHKGA